MKAAVWTKYGPPEVLEIKNIEKPIPKDNEVLIKVNASTVTAGDCELRSFDLPLWLKIPLRPFTGLFKPRIPVLGQEFAGEIVAIGNKENSGLKVGDHVFGGTNLKMGSHAQFKTHQASYFLAQKPKNISFEEATTIAVGGTNAIHFMELAKVQPGEKVMVYGATGSIGTYAVQIAKHLKAEVSAVCGTPNVDLVQSLGATHVIDYMKEDYTLRDEKYDVIFEAVGKSSFERGLKCLNDNGRFIIANPKFYQLFKAMWFNKTNKRGQKVIFQFASDSTEYLNKVAQLLSDGHIKSVIDRYYPLEELREAHRYVEKGQKTGHVVIQVGHKNR